MNVTQAGLATAHPNAHPSAADAPRLSPQEWGMLTFLMSEVAFFSTLIVTYLTYLGKEGQPPPTPATALSLPLVIGTTACLLSSSGTVHLAEMALHRGFVGRFAVLWSATILLGIVFLSGTAYEWHELIFHKGLTISTNLFGSTYYTLVGFHALHVTIGVIVLITMLIVVLRHKMTPKHAIGVKLGSWYWHFVDVVWVIVFTVVYLVSR
jgi:cytochrome c oxidase subunit 3/cytochrome o ubiquinol oxidase subunit 3